jgi:hypothetical protein
MPGNFTLDAGTYNVRELMNAGVPARSRDESSCVVAAR